MTQINTITSTHPDTPVPDTPVTASSFLLNLIAALLAPTFLGVTAGDVGLAKAAAIETVAAYRARNEADLIAIAQIIAFGLAALGSLSLSMTDDISLPMTLRLRGNANALNRSGEQNRRVLRQGAPGGRETPSTPSEQTYAALPEAKTPTKSDEDADQARAEAFLSLAAQQQLAAESQARLQEPKHLPDPMTAHPAASAIIAAAQSGDDKRHKAMWAIAMVRDAADITASLENLPPTERHAASMRAAALGSCANDLLYGGPLPCNKPTCLDPRTAQPRR